MGGCTITPVCPSCFGLCFYRIVTDDRQEKGKTLNQSGEERGEESFFTTKKMQSIHIVMKYNKNEH